MKKYFLVLCLGLATLAQGQYLTTPSDGGNKKASVSEKIGLTEVQIHYDRPAVKGRDGKIWGQLVHFGYQDLGFGPSKAAPWRAGANENTVISFSTDVKIEGKELAAGAYGLFMAVQENEVTVIFSKNASSWGSYFYDPSEDALQVTVKPQKDQPFTERLQYEFVDQTDNSATVTLRWERWKIPFKVEADVHKQVLASFRNELRGEKGFVWQSWQQAASYCLRNNVSLEEGLRWADRSISEPFVGEANFTTLSTKAQILNKLGRGTDADAAMKEAVLKGNLQELHNYARQLQSQKKSNEALEIFKLNAAKNPNVFTTNIGLARGYSAVGDYKNALKYAKQALPQAPDEQNKTSVEKMIQLLTENKDVN
jgi:tetratricopeptide (TPR) repeat protein